MGKIYALVSKIDCACLNTSPVYCNQYNKVRGRCSHCTAHGTKNPINNVPLHPVVPYRWLPIIDPINTRKRFWLGTHNTQIASASFCLSMSVWFSLLYMVENELLSNQK